MIVALVNPLARQVARDPGLVERLRKALGDAGRLASTRSKEELRAVLTEARADGCRTVAICGGDGTHVFVLTELLHVWQDTPLPSLALLRGGTINIVADNVGIFGPPERTLARIARPAPGAADRAVHLDTLRVNGRCGFIFAAGLPSRLLSHYYDGRGTGRGRAVRLVGRALGSAIVRGAFVRSLTQPLGAELQLDGDPPARQSPNVLLATTVINVGLGLRVGYRLTGGMGAFHALALRAEGRHLWTSLVPARMGRPGFATALVDGLAQRLTVRFDDVEVCQLDGEMFSAQRVDVELGPRFRFERP